MKSKHQVQAHSSSEVFFKLTILGCLMLGFVYSFLLIFNSMLQAIH